MPWFTVQRATTSDLFIHVHRYMYYNDHYYGTCAEYETILDVSLRESVNAIWQQANEDNRQLIVEFNEEWGGYLNV